MILYVVFNVLLSYSKSSFSEAFSLCFFFLLAILSLQSDIHL